MSPAHRSFRPALLFTTALLLSSCGIPETGVVEAGEPATGIRPVQTLYFVREDDLFAVRRRAVGPDVVEAALAAVFRGPEDPERRKGMTTELPPLGLAPTTRTDGGRVSVELPRGTGPLTRTALAQLTCTVADALLVEAPDTDTASTRVTVTVPDAWRVEGSGETCPSATGESATGASSEAPRAGRSPLVPEKS